MLQILPRFPCKTLPPKQIARPQTLGRCFKNQLKHTGWQLAPSYRKPKLLEFAGKFPYMDHHGYGETSRWIGWNHASPAKGWWLFRDLHWKKPYQISRGKVWVQGTVSKDLPSSTSQFLSGEPRKKTLRSFPLYWLVNRDSYFMVYYNPYIKWVV